MFGGLEAFSISIVQSVISSLLVLFFGVELDYNNLLSNLLFSFLLYIIFAYIFDIYHKFVFGRSNVW